MIVELIQYYIMLVESLMLKHVCIRIRFKSVYYAIIAFNYVFFFCWAKMEKKSLKDEFRVVRWENIFDRSKSILLKDINVFRRFRFAYDTSCCLQCLVVFHLHLFSTQSRTAKIYRICFILTLRQIVEKPENSRALTLSVEVELAIYCTKIQLKQKRNKWKHIFF